MSEKKRGGRERKEDKRETDRQRKRGT
jgi:hypothetical protein